MLEIYNFLVIFLLFIIIISDILQFNMASSDPLEYGISTLVNVILALPQQQENMAVRQYTLSVLVLKSAAGTRDSTEEKEVNIEVVTDFVAPQGSASDTTVGTFQGIL